jgi:NADPH-dependent 2,4-dienoyl-CoA reductase/sulfur reductase-like enzyme
MDSYDVVVVGAGPAGLAAARAAAECGKRVAMVDDNPAPGGQIWRGEKLPVPAVKVICGARVVAAPAPGLLTLESYDASFDIGYDALVIATGARERFLPFPGWTLPHVAGAGGLQALVKSGMPIAGKRVVVAGSGPLLLAVAAYLKKRGATVPLVAEQANGWMVTRFGLSLPLAKMLQGMKLRAGIRYVTGCWPVSAAPGSVTLSRGGTVACDYLACGFGLVPNTELLTLVGGPSERVFAAGEVTGIGGLELSIVEGVIAGFTAGGQPDRARGLLPDLEKHRRFADSLERAFALRPELRGLATDETFVCRCEDVTLGRLRAWSGWREAKLQTRCGMGACQGRVCGPAVEFLLGWKSESVRPPVFPARVGTLTEKD